MHAVWQPVRLLLLVVVFGLNGCASSAPGASTPQQPQPAPPAPTLKRVVAAIQGEPFTLSGQINTAGGSSTVRGVDEIEQLVHAGMATADDRGGMKAQLAAQMPTVENGAWQVESGGRMTTTWRLRPEARWHDGAPVTAADFAFAVEVGRDRDLASFRNRSFDAIASVETPDTHTVIVRWSQPFVRADTLFSGGVDRLALPLPAHLLELTFRTDRATFLELPYWSTEFVGTGPFALRTWQRESHLLLQAHSAYPTGRPKLDEIEVRFVPDQNTLLATILAGAVEMTLGRSIGIDQAVHVREQWREGRVEMAPDSWLAIFPQFTNPSPVIVGDVNFRRALLHAIDRQEMVDTIQAGLSSVAHSFMHPNQALLQEVERRQVVRYEFDLRRAAQLMEQLGYHKGSDNLYQDGAGTKLAIEIRASATDLNQKSMFAVANYWHRLGVSTETYPIPRQLASNDEFRATFPGFEVTRRGNDLRGLPNLHSSQIPLLSNRFTGGNNGRYANPELDRLLDAFSTTIPQRERVETLGKILHHLTDQVIVLGLFYDPQPVLIATRLRNVAAKPTPQSTQAWNAELWDTM